MQFRLCKYGHVQPTDDMTFMELQLFYDSMIKYSQEEKEANENAAR
jgi:hypothetical protein